LSVHGDLGVFFNEGPKLIHLDLGEFEVPEKHVTDLFTMQGGNGQPLADGIELDFQDPGGAPKSQAFGHQPQTHKDSLLGTTKIEKGGAGTTGKGLATGPTEKEPGFPGTSGSVGSIGDHIGQPFLSMVLTSGIRTSDIKVFCLRTTPFLYSLGHPLSLLGERIP
jgi:hypothetical protein